MNIIVNGYIIKTMEVNPSGKETVLFLHGWPLNQKMFEYQWRELASKDIHCVGIDLIGFGGSSKPSNGYDYDNLAAIVDGAIRELNLNDIILLGFSMGGAIAVRYLSKYGDSRVKKLILLSAACPSFVRRDDFMYGNEVETVDLMIENVINDKPEAFAKFSDLVFSQDISPEFANWFNNMSNEAAVWSAQQTLQSLRDEDLREDLTRINVQTAIFHGTADRVCPFGLAEQMSLRLANSFMLPFENGGHGMFYEQRDKLNTAILDFVTNEIDYQSPAQSFSVKTAEDAQSPQLENKQAQERPKKIHQLDYAIKQSYEFKNAPLPYDYDALEPFIDQKTMHLHHDVHLQSYVDKLNAALKKHTELHGWSLEELLSHSHRLPNESKVQIERNAGGVFNHFFFFDGLSAQRNEPTGALTSIINKSFGSMQSFIKSLSDAALSVFGSGYAWLVLDRNRRLEIVTTTGQETPLSQGKKPILNIDVWEHAYYLKYNAGRADYIQSILNIINWRAIELRLM